MIANRVDSGVLPQLHIGSIKMNLSSQPQKSITYSMFFRRGLLGL